MNPEQLEEVTKVPCPKCDGEAFVVLESSATVHRGVRCSLCDGIGAVSAADFAAYRQKHPLMARAR